MTTSTNTATAASRSDEEEEDTDVHGTFSQEIPWYFTEEHA